MTLLVLECAWASTDCVLFVPNHYCSIQARCAKLLFQRGRCVLMVQDSLEMQRAACYSLAALFWATETVLGRDLVQGTGVIYIPNKKADSLTSVFSPQRPAWNRCRETYRSTWFAPLGFSRRSLRRAFPDATLTEAKESTLVVRSLEFNRSSVNFWIKNYVIWRITPDTKEYFAMDLTSGVEFGSKVVRRHCPQQRCSPDYCGMRRRPKRD
jgi:hypothetical protein